VDVILSNFPAELEFDAKLPATVERAAVKVGELYGLDSAEVSVTLTDNVYIHELNKKYRGIDRPTDVLSFALNEGNDRGIRWTGSQYARRYYYFRRTSRGTSF